MRSIFKQFMRDEAGATAIEYGMIAAAIALAIIVAGKSVSGQINNTFNTAGNTMANR